jgi:hypothetical protein
VWCISVSDEEHAIASLQPVGANTYVTLFGNENALHLEILGVVPQYTGIFPVFEVFHSIIGRFVDIVLYSRELYFSSQVALARVQVVACDGNDWPLMPSGFQDFQAIAHPDGSSLTL